MGSIADIQVTDNVTDVLAAQINSIWGSVFRGEYSNPTTMSGTVTLADSDYAIQRFNCNGVNRIVKMPAVANANHPYLIVNATAATYTLDVQSNAGVTLLSALLAAAGGSCMVVPDGSTGYKLVGGGGTWGSITGTLSSQTDLYAALGKRNAIINGALDVWQRGTTTLTNPVTTTYFPDRFSTVHVIGDGTFNLLASAETPAANFPFQYSLHHDTTHIETAVAAGEYSTLQYKVEGYDFKRFEGTQATLSFWVRATKTGIYCVAFRNSAVNKSYVHEFTVNVSNTWEQKTVTLTFNSGGTFLYTTGIGLIISWAIMCGSTFQIATANKDTWQAGNYMASDAQVNGMDNTANDFKITGIQLELGSVATPFECVPVSQILGMCQRYYQENMDANAAFEYSFVGATTGATTQELIARFLQAMRVPPTLGYSGNFEALDGSVSKAVSSMSIDQVGIYSCRLNVNAATGLTAGKIGFIRASNDATARLNFAAEL